MKIKVCGNNNKLNTKEVSELKPDFMGFICYDKSPRFINIDELKATVASINGVKKVGVFVNESVQNIKKTIEDLSLDLVQLHGNESVEFCDEMRNISPIIKVMDGNSDNLKNEVDKFNNVVDFYLVDNKGKEFGGTGQKFSLENLKEINFPHPFFVAGGIGPNDFELIKQLNEIPNFYGIDVNSKFESAPGIKNIDYLRSFINNIRNETN